MSDLAANLALPYLAPSQAQKHVTHNEAFQILDAVAQLVVVARDLSMPPGAPETGARYIVVAAATGDWAGHEVEVALWSGTGWIFLVPQTGWRAWDVAAQVEVAFYDGLWQVAAGSDTPSQLGINATADAVDRLAVSAPATLLNHEGAGHQLKVNKATAGDTASLLFQAGFSGRAETGLAGNDAWSIKVSADGATWTDALTVDPYPERGGAWTATAIFHQQTGLWHLMLSLPHRPDASEDARFPTPICVIADGVIALPQSSPAKDIQ